MCIKMEGIFSLIQYASHYALDIYRSSGFIYVLVGKNMSSRKRLGFKWWAAGGESCPTWKARRTTCALNSTVSSFCEEEDGRKNKLSLLICFGKYLFGYIPPNFTNLMKLSWFSNHLKAPPYTDPDEDLDSILQVWKIEASMPYITLMGILKSNLKINQINLLSSFKKKKKTIPGPATNHRHISVQSCFQNDYVMRETDQVKPCDQFRLGHISGGRQVPSKDSSLCSPSFHSNKNSLR